MGAMEAGAGVAPWTLRGGGTGVLRGAGGEAGPGAALRGTDCGLVPAAAWAGDTEANGSEFMPGAAGLELKNDMGEGNIEEAGAGTGAPSLAEAGVTGGPRGGWGFPPPPTKLSSSALGSGGRVAVIPKLSAMLKPPDPPARRGLLGGFFAILKATSLANGNVCKYHILYRGIQISPFYTFLVSVKLVIYTSSPQQTNCSRCSWLAVQSN